MSSSSSSCEILCCCRSQYLDQKLIAPPLVSLPLLLPSVMARPLWAVPIHASPPHPHKCSTILQKKLMSDSMPRSFLLLELSHSIARFSRLGRMRRQWKGETRRREGSSEETHPTPPALRRRRRMMSSDVCSMCTAFLAPLESFLEGSDEKFPSHPADGSPATCCQKEDLEHSRKSTEANSPIQSSSFPSNSLDMFTYLLHFSAAAAAAAAVADPRPAAAAAAAADPARGTVPPAVPFCRAEASCFRLNPPIFSIRSTASTTSRRSSTSSPSSSPGATPSLLDAARKSSRRSSWWFQRNCRAGSRSALPSAASCRRATKSLSVGRRRRWKRWQRTPPVPSERRSERT
mmetsp:Transcript_6620/g.23378  ORF Transcript_6620/g.23378 Transcript_6620/m.23378 type:complete len:347 (-) Transcript_6620:1836-2876(-)